MMSWCQTLLGTIPQREQLVAAAAGGPYAASRSVRKTPLVQEFYGRSPIKLREEVIIIIIKHQLTIIVKTQGDSISSETKSYPDLPYLLSSRSPPKLHPP